MTTNYPKRQAIGIKMGEDKHVRLRGTRTIFIT